MLTWTPVEELQPADGERVELWLAPTDKDPEGKAGPAFGYLDHKMYATETDESYRRLGNGLATVTHWRPIVSPAQEAEADAATPDELLAQARRLRFAVGVQTDPVTLTFGAVALNLEAMILELGLCRERIAMSEAIAALPATRQVFHLGEGWEDVPARMQEGQRDPTMPALKRKPTQPADAFVPTTVGVTWRHVDDALPEDCAQEYLVWIDDGHSAQWPRVAWVGLRDKQWTDTDGRHVWHVTHWAPINAPTHEGAYLAALENGVATPEALGRLAHAAEVLLRDNPFRGQDEKASQWATGWLAADQAQAEAVADG